MISSGLLVCSFYLKKKFSRGNDDVINLNNQIFGDENQEYDDIVVLFNAFLSEAIETKDDERSMKLFSVLPESIKIMIVKHTEQYLLLLGQDHTD